MSISGFTIVLTNVLAEREVNRQVSLVLVVLPEYSNLVPVRDRVNIGDNYVLAEQFGVLAHGA